MPLSHPPRPGKRERTAEHIVAVAYELFERHGYDAVTMEQIALAADVAKGTLYNHFPAKEALIRHRMHADLARALPGLLASFPPDADCDRKLRLFLAESARYTVAARAYVKPYLSYRLHNAPDGNRSGLDKVYTRLLAEGQARGEIVADPPAEVLAEMLGYLHLAVMVRWLGEPESDLNAAFERMLDVFLRGCGKKGRP